MQIKVTMSIEEQTECPLCMELLEMDDLNFYPCTCGYQICRFCWHRIRTDENGLCPACRKQYPEDPAEFKPLTEDELQRIKKERRQKDLHRKQKAAENRKHLANVRVVQKNLVFVVGLSQRLADPEVLKKPEYFGKFGKIHKVVINHSTSYAGSQVCYGPSASAYVTFNRPEDALRALQFVNNIHVDGRTLKASLGTTKYCSHFLRGAQCPKTDCMYLHELGEDAASFTKEEMQQGKHQEYEQKLYEQFMNNQNIANSQNLVTQSAATTPPPLIPQGTSLQPKFSSRKKTSSPCDLSQLNPDSGQTDANTNKEAWPSLSDSNGSVDGESIRIEALSNGNKSGLTSLESSSSSTSSSSTCPSPTSSFKHDTQNAQSRAPGHQRTKSSEAEIVNNVKVKIPITNGQPFKKETSDVHCPVNVPLHTVPTVPPGFQQHSHPAPSTNTQTLLQNTLQTNNATRKPPFDNTLSLFSNTGFSGNRNARPVPSPNPVVEQIPVSEIPETITVASTTDWQAAFGFSSTKIPNIPLPVAPEPQHINDDDLGFDPWDESSKALQDLIEKEGVNHYNFSQRQLNNVSLNINFSRVENKQNNISLPPGLHNTHINNNSPYPPMGFQSSKMLGLMHYPQNVQNYHSQKSYHEAHEEALFNRSHSENVPPFHSSYNQNDVYSMKDWQEGLRALLPNINISFGAPPQPSSNSSNSSQPQQHNTHTTHKNWTPDDISWDPAILTSGAVTDRKVLEEPPHWMASLHHLTEDNTNYHMPSYIQQIPYSGHQDWAVQHTQNPPPGFHQQTRFPIQIPEPQKLTEGLQ